MRIPFSRSSVLTAVTTAIIVLVLPGAIRRVVQSGDPYLLTERFCEDMWVGITGSGRSMRDSQTKSPPFLSLLAFRRAHRPKLLRHAISSARDLVAIAIILDLIAQAVILREVHPAAALLVGPVLIAVPYSIFRTLANRIATWRAQEMEANRSTRPHGRKGREV